MRRFSQHCRKQEHKKKKKNQTKEINIRIPTNKGLEKTRKMVKSKGLKQKK